VGDSYAAGLGSGPRLDYGCSRYGHGYPNLINNDERMGDGSNRTFQDLSCSGYKSTDMLIKQVPHLKKNLDVLTVSAGGNDVGLGEVLDACIFQWRHGNGLKCEASLNRTQDLIENELSANLDALINSLLPKLSHKGKIYYPGYAQFFGESIACNNLSWAVWPRMPPTDKQNLTLARRIQMNDLVDQVNDKIKASVEKAGPRVVFIDWDWVFIQAKGRFCESPYIEPAPDRKGLLFFEWNTLDDGDDPDLLIRPYDPVPEDSFEGDIGKWVLETLMEYPDIEFGPLGDDPMLLSEEAKNNAESQNRFKAQLGFEDAVFWFLPDSWKRVFHPRALGHHLIADMILHEMAVHRGKELGVKVPPYSYQNVLQNTKLEL
jgi:hypothetical protein